MLGMSWVAPRLDRRTMRHHTVRLLKLPLSTSTRVQPSALPLAGTNQLHVRASC